MIKNYNFGDHLVYTSPQNESLKTPCVYIRNDKGLAVIIFENAEWVARVNHNHLSRMCCSDGCKHYDGVYNSKGNAPCLLNGAIVMWNRHCCHWEQSEQKCDCYKEKNGTAVCYGTKEREVCSCGGDKNKCNFRK